MCLRIQSRISGDYIGNSGVAQLTMLVLLVLCLALPATVPTQVRAEDGPVIELPDVSDDTKRKLRDTISKIGHFAKKYAKPRGPRTTGGDPFGPVADLMLNSDKISLGVLITMINKTIERYHVEILSQRDMTADAGEVV